MAYQVEYELQGVTVTKRDFRKEAAAVIAWATVLVVLALSVHFLGHVCNMLLVEKGQIARDAAEKLVDELQSGAPLQDAVQVFYWEITQ